MAGANPGAAEMHPRLAIARFERALAGITAELCTERGWTIHSRSYPVLDVGFTSLGGGSLRLRLQCDRWNALPPSVALLTSDGQPFPAGRTIASSTGIFHVGPHPNTRAPFVCMRGTREYHTHDSHLTDAWEALRDSPDFSLGEIVTQIWRGWLKANP